MAEHITTTDRLLDIRELVVPSHILDRMERKAAQALNAGQRWCSFCGSVLHTDARTVVVLNETIGSECVKRLTRAGYTW